MNTANTHTHQSLTLDEANKIGGALHDLAVLAEKKIFETDDAAKKRAWLSYVQDNLLLHAEEFLAAWFTMEQEYKPMLQAQATVMGHVLTIIQRRQQIQDAQQQQQPKVPVEKCGCADPAACPCKTDNPNCECTQSAEPVPSNVVPLNP